MLATAIVGIALSLTPNADVIPWEPIPECLVGMVTDCADPSGEGITVNGFRFFACDLQNSTAKSGYEICFTYSVQRDGSVMWQLHD